jgi:hypothetical protein
MAEELGACGRRTASNQIGKRVVLAVVRWPRHRQLGLEVLRAVVEWVIGAGSRWFTSWRLRLGVMG